MKTFLTVILSFSFTLTAIGQTPPDSGFTHKAEAKNELVNGVKEGKWMEYFNGRFAATDTAEAQNYRLTIYKGGNPYGIVREYYREGMLYFITHYTEGKENGLRINYNKSGELIEKAPYINGEVNGVVKEYYKSGKIHIEVPITNGKENGVEKTYYESGELEKETTYVEDRKNGVEKEYYTSGKLKKEISLSNGKEDGIKREYYESGNLYFEGTFTDGKVNGVSKFYYENGALDIEMPFKSGKENGIEEEYFEDGKLKRITHFKNGDNGWVEKDCYESDEQDWIPIDSGANGYVSSLVVYKGELYASGEFDLFFSNSQRQINNMAKWDGVKWSRVGEESIEGKISTMLEYKGELYAGGNFTIHKKHIKNIAKWNGRSWETVGDGTMGKVILLTEYDKELYACNEINMNESCILKKIGKKWLDVSGKIKGSICALTVFKGKLYCIGNYIDSTFSDNSNNSLKNKTWRGNRPDRHTPLYLASYNGKNWKRIDSTSYFNKTHLDNVVSVSIFKNNFYIASHWTYPIGECDGTVSSFVKWDGTNEATEADKNDKKYAYVTGAMGVYNNELYAYGNFWLVENASVVYFAKWDGVNWSYVKKVNGWNWEAANSMCVYKDELYFGGKEYGASQAHCVAKLVYDSTYYENRKLKSKTFYIYGKAVITKTYDENGNEIK